jgi:CRP-like cAMP-binding protein
VAEVGPGAILGEMAQLQDGRRTATLRAVTPCRVAVVPGDRLYRGALQAVPRAACPSLGASRSESGSTSFEPRSGDQPRVEK